LHVAVAFVAGALATWIAGAFSLAATEVRLAAAGVAGLLCGSPWLVPVDDHVAAELRRLGRRCSHPLARARLADAVELRRRIAARLKELPRGEARRIEQAFAVILRLCRQLPDASSAAAVGSPVGRLVADLWRAEHALGRRTVLSSDADPAATAELERVVDGIEAEAAALAEVAGTRRSRDAWM
jgi:hypothetical protein